MLVGDKYAALKMAPTGKAAIACGGNVVDAVLRFNRNDRKHTKLAPTDSFLQERQQMFKHTKMLLNDEFSMWGSRMLASYSCRCNEIFNEGKFDDFGDNADEYFGGVNMVIFTGDLMQLQPVLDRAPYNVPETAPPFATIGRNVYKEIEHVFLLDKSVRQENDTEFMKI